MEWFQNLKEARLLLITSQMGRSFSNYVRTNSVFSFHWSGCGTHFIGKDSDSGRHWGQEEKGMTEDEMAGWHH